MAKSTRTLVFVVAPRCLGKRAAPSKKNNTIRAIKRSLVAIAAVFAVVFAVQLSAPDAEAAAPLGRVVALGDSLASGQGLGPQAPGSIADCGRSTGGYPEVAMSRVTHGAWVNATCNATTTDNFEYGWTGPSGAAVPRQYDSLNGSEDLVIVGSGNNEAFFGKIAYDCTGYQPTVNAFFHNRDYPQQTPWPVPNHCSDTYPVNSANQIPNYIAAGKPKVAAALSRIHQLSPNAKIILVGKPRLAKPSGSQCFNSEFWLTATDAPLYATWEDGARQAMIDTVNAFNSSVPGNYAHFVDIQGISGTSHTACETNASERWINPHPNPPGPGYSGIPLHHSPLGASVTANAIIDVIHAAGFDTGANPTKPVVTISSPASGTVTTNATIPVSFSATDNIRIASCSVTSGASVALSPGTNTIVVTCFDDAGNSDSKSVTVMRDAAPPVISISSPANGSGTSAASTQLFYTATDDVGTPSCTPASGASFALSTGANNLSVSCTDSVGRSATASITVYRGTPPVVAISAPANGTKTASATTNVSYTVNGTAAIPGGTSCKVNGAASGSATTNNASLAIGANSIVVDCTNLFGNGSSSVTVTRGVPPVVAITAPASGLNIPAGSVNVTYSVDGGSSLPAGTTCTVNGAASANTGSNSVALSIGSNTITVACTNAFGSSSAAVTVSHGVAPVVAITAPANGLNTTAALVNAIYTVDGSSSIPAGTNCTVNGSASANTGSNSVALANGSNTITVVCTNAFGSTPISISVNRGNPPAVAITAPSNGLNTTAASVNAIYTVGGGSSIPAGTTCTVNGSASSSTSANGVALAIGSNTITVVCTNAFGSNSSSISVNRGNPPAVAITAPSNGLNTTAASVNAIYTVGGGSSIPAGTTCTVNGVASTSTSSNSVALALGSNTITVACTNAFGSTPISISVNRGNPPTVAITAPADGLKTTAASMNVSFTVNGAATIPGGTTCTIGGSGTSSATVNPFSLALGANTITVACTNAFGGGNAAITVTRGVVPSVAITAPANGLNTTATSVNVSYTVDGSSVIPGGTTCTVNGAASASTGTNSVALALGANTITVACTNAFGGGNTAITVTRGVVPSVAITAPANGLNTPTTSVNVTYTVGGAGTIPGGTTCTVNGVASTSTSSNSVALALGSNTITVACTNAFGSTPISISVNRGNPPTVAITAPADGLKTTAASANVSFTVNGAASIPGGTSCTVNGSSTSSAAANPFALALGANSIAVACTNAFGGDNAAVTVTRGVVPSVAITAPSSGLNTTASSVNVTYTVDGGSSIPGGTTCTVNGAASASTGTNSVALALGANTITVACTNAFGSTPSSISVNRGIAPVVAITAPANGLSTTATSVNATYTVGGADTIPGGTTCTVNGAASASTSSNNVALTLGANTITVACGNAFGNGNAAITVTRGVAPVVAILVPADNTLTSAASVNTAFSLNGAASIPGGTTCSVNGVPTTDPATNSVALGMGSNSITVTCSDAFGTDSDTVTVVRGTGPSVAITAPGNGLNTTASGTNVAFTVDGATSIPNGTTCTVNGAAATSVGTNTFALALGSNTIEVACSNALGSDTQSVIVYRGNPPTVALTAPADGLKTTATSTNVSFTVNGAASIPGGTSCTVGGSSTLSATVNPFSLALGANTITVVCTNAFGSNSGSIAVTRGNAPVVAITAPADGAKTTFSSTNVTFNVNGAGTIPSGATCTVGGSSTTSATTNPFSLALGANTITVACTNAFGSDNVAVTVTRGVVPAVAITAPSSGLNTTASSVNVTYTVDGGSSIPAGTTCTVNGSASANAGSNSVALALGSNTISVGCTNAFGSTPRSISVNRGNGPVVALTAPADGLKTTATSTNVSFTVNGAGTIPGGTSCTVNGSPSASTSTNSVALSLGANSITVACTNAFGSGNAAVAVTRGVAPVVAIALPANNTVTSAASVNTVFSLNGASSIPSGAACSVNDVATTNPVTNSVALGMGSNSITVTCSDAFGTDSDTVTVVRGTGPSVVITAPGNGLNTTASSTNVAFTVNGAASIPNGTTCTVNGATTNSAGTNAVALALGSNTIEVACSNSLGDDTQSVIVYRGNPPAVAITAPADGLKTTAASANVSFTVNGAASIPGGTTCTVGGSSTSSATTNPFSLALGANTITVACTNAFGSDNLAVTVTRGVVPSVAITAPANGFNTTASSVNVTYTVDGGSSIPAGTTCTVNGSASANTGTNSVALALGSNTISVACTNAFGSTPASIAVNREVVDTIPPGAPTVTRTNPTITPTDSRSQTVAFEGAEPDGVLSCKVNNSAYLPCPPSPVTLTELNDGDYSFSVTQTDAAGNVSPAGTVTWKIEPAAIEPVVPSQPTPQAEQPSPPPPTPTPTPTPTKALSAKLSSVSPKKLVPARTGKPFSLKRRKRVGSFRLTLSKSAKVSVRLERVVRKRSRAATRWTKFKLKPGKTVIYFSGRTKRRSLKPGTYKVRIKIRGIKKSLYSRSFRIKR